MSEFFRGDLNFLGGGGQWGSDFFGGGVVCHPPGYCQ